jgi:Tol biopolymer transport system component
MSGLSLAPGITYNVCSAKVDGSGLTPLTSEPIRRSFPWISPDGRSIAYASAAPDEQGSYIYVMDRDGHNQRQITFGEKLNCISPSYSPDGRKIVFACAARRRPYSTGGKIWDDWDIWEMNADGSSLRQLTAQRFYLVDPPYFSPVGNSVLFAAETESQLNNHT